MPEFRDKPTDEPISYKCEPCGVGGDWTKERYIAHRVNFHRPLQLALVGETIVEAVDGCTVGVRGRCPHGFNSWPTELSFIRRRN